MKQAPQPFASFDRRKLWIQIPAFLAIVTLIWLMPKIEEWIDANDPPTELAVTDDSANDVARSSARSETPSVDPEDSTSPPKTGIQANSTELGRLKETGNNVFQSSGGLVYRSGSEDGHRLKHVMQHAKDNPQKKIHGVFDGDGDRHVVLAIIDEAWLKAKKGGSDVRSERQNDRQVYTINLRRRIGQVGGEEGERKGNPECSYVRLVLENDNEVISAYPTRSF